MSAEETIALLSSTFSSENDSKAASEALNNKGMDADFIQILLEIVQNTEIDNSIQLAALNYIKYRVTNTFETITEEGKEILQRNYPNILLNTQACDIKFKNMITNVMCSYFYIHNMDLTLEILDALLSDIENTCFGFVIIVKCITKKMRSFTNRDQMLGEFLSKYNDSLTSIFINTDNLYIKRCILKTYNNCFYRKELWDHFFNPELLEYIAAPLENTQDRYYDSYIISVIYYWLYIHINTNEARDYSGLFVFLFEKVISLDSEKPKEILFGNLYLHHGGVVLDVLSENFNSLITDIMIPLFALNEQDIENATELPVRFIAENTTVARTSDVRSKSCSLLEEMAKEIPDVPNFIAQLCQEAFENYVSDGNSVILFQIVRLITAGWKIFKKVDSDNSYIFERLLIENFEEYDILAQTACIMLIGSQLDNSPPPPTDIALFLVSALGFEPLPRCMAVYALKDILPSIFHNEESSADFCTKFEFDFGECVNTTLELINEFADPELIIVVSAFLHIQQPLEVIVETAGDMIQGTFQAAQTLVQASAEEDENEIFDAPFIFSNIKNLLIAINGHSEQMAAVTEALVEGIAESSDLMNTFLLEPIADLAAAVARDTLHPMERLWDIAEALFGRVEAIGNQVDIQTAIGNMIGNTIVSDPEGTIAHEEFVSQAASSVLLRYVCPAIIYALPSDCQLVQDSFGLLIEHISMMANSIEDMYQIEDMQHCLLAGFLLDPAAVMEAFGEFGSGIIANWTDFGAPLAYAAYSVMRAWDILDPETRLIAMRNLLDARPSNFTEYTVYAYDSDSLDTQTNLKTVIPIEQMRDEFFLFLEEIEKNDPELASKINLSQYMILVQNFREEEMQLEN